jgi:hypothetical protein
MILPHGQMVVSDNGGGLTGNAILTSRSEPHRMALHRAAQAHAERLHRARQELQAFC